MLSRVELHRFEEKNSTCIQIQELEEAPSVPNIQINGLLSAQVRQVQWLEPNERTRFRNEKGSQTGGVIPRLQAPLISETGTTHKG